MRSWLGSGGTVNHLEMSGDESEQSTTRDITAYEELVHTSIPHVVAWLTGLTARICTSILLRV